MSFPFYRRRSDTCAVCSIKSLVLSQRKTKSGNLRTMELFVLFFDGEMDSKKVRVVLSLEDMDMSELYNNATYN